QKACTLDGRHVSAPPSRQSSMHLKLQNSPVLQPQRASFALWATALRKVQLFSGHYNGFIPKQEPPSKQMF
ncbi:MAG: hypothetical protein RSC86_07370, partial [Oscillospiraceae bacterium]